MTLHGSQNHSGVFGGVGFSIAPSSPSTEKNSHKNIPAEGLKQVDGRAIEVI
jgi:hypothetical protein